MPVSEQNKPIKRLTLAELIELRINLPPPVGETASASLADRFLVPPFSVLDARQGYWQKRKKEWIALGIKSELGRGGTPSTSARVGEDEPATYSPIGGRKADNGLLGESEQARSHYKANATPGGSPLPAASLKGGKTQRGDGRGRPLAQTYGSGDPGDLAAGFKSKADNRAIQDHAWLAKRGKRIPQAGVDQPQTTLGAIAPNETGENGILSRTGRYATGGAKPLYGAYEQDDDTSRRIAAAQPQSGTSIFDPVICELVYRWFAPPTGRVLDPFAGGSVRGIVASKLGRRYTGIDLRAEQIAANEEQAEEIVPGKCPKWVVADSTGVEKLAAEGAVDGEYDLVFSCPPYADLERYSDDPLDISTMEYDEFRVAYENIIAASCALLADDSFACFVVGDVRDKRGMYRGFVSDTCAAFAKAGLQLYNECILVTAVGSLSIRVGRQFTASRKVGKTHQNVLVFVKGDPVRAVAKCGKVDVSDLEMPECSPGAVAVCRQDVGDEWVDYLADDGSDAPVVDLPLVEACLLCDVIRGRARSASTAVSRVWVPAPQGWSALEDADELTYVVGGAPYLRRVFFPDAVEPASTAPQPERLR